MAENTFNDTLKTFGLTFDKAADQFGDGLKAVLDKGGDVIDASLNAIGKKLEHIPYIGRSLNNGFDKAGDIADKFLNLAGERANKFFDDIGDEVEGYTAAFADNDLVGSMARDIDSKAIRYITDSKIDETVESWRNTAENWMETNLVA